MNVTSSPNSVINQRRSILSTEMKLVPLELLIYRVMFLSCNAIGSIKLKTGCLLELISSWYVYYGATLSIVKKMGLISSLAHHLTVRWPKMANATNSLSFAPPSLKAYSTVLNSVRNILMSWPDTPISLTVLSVICFPKVLPPICPFELGNNEWWSLSMHRLIPAKFTSLLTDKETREKRAWQSFYTEHTKRFKLSDQEK
ncbi:hypothetical protein [McMurdo Ice Shelf pond-associated circular DNA virus-1]|uniref:hypothetical protein n=1 Tax=McMurdo Ice Shelf pond-associated circular DNA virus-1 TaxID=1521385 RepID=UPI0004D19FA2|nr:hypothetical protein [McMurdo Ice Shelf pond-associated circular DNA virus-1]AIF71502.1 hypothetical protein [McMurdo Ice Shelf pond-associated circular DNA virus-1]